MSEAKPKVVVVMPAYNAAKTLHLTYADLPRDVVDSIILVDDGSSDETVRIARDLGLELFIHNRNYGYGANQKTCYREALKAGAEIIVMLHPDYQYDPTLLPQIIRPILDGTADIVLGSRLLGADPVKQGMPWWKYVANRFLTWLQNKSYGLELAEYHTGGRLKVAPEHTSPKVLELMKKPNIDNFGTFADEFKQASADAGKPKQQIIPYFIASHPASDLDAMIHLAVFLAGDESSWITGALHSIDGGRQLLSAR